MISWIFGKTDTLYIVFANDICLENKHPMISTDVEIELIDGEKLLLKGQYCIACNQVQVSRNVWAKNSKYHNKVIDKTILKGLDDIPIEEAVIYNNIFEYPERAQESVLKKYGYSVSWDNPLSTRERQELLKKLINSNRVSKGYTITHLKHLIQINGKKKDNEFAVMKWKDDLDFLYKL